MWRAVQSGREFPEYVSEEEYKHIKEHKDDDPALTGFVGFGCSFAGKWFGGYARSNGKRCYADEAKRSIERIAPRIRKMEFLNMDYRDVPIPPNSTVYADPPYKGKTGYGGKFDTDAFWEYMRKLSKDGHRVFVSELEAPTDFKVIWSKPILRSIDRNKENKIIAEEKLFVYGG